MAGEGDAERLVVLLEARIRDFEKNFAKASGTATNSYGKMRQQSRSATRQMEADMMRSTSRINLALASTSTRIGSFGKAMSAGFLAPLAGLLSLTAAVNGAKGALDAFSDIADNAKSTGLDAETFQALAYQAEQSGVAFDTFSKGLEAFNKNAGLAVVGKGRMVTALKALNPALLANIQAATTQEQRVRLAADAIDKAGSASEKAALSTALFGDAGAKLADAFAGGAAQIDAMAAKARDLGLIIDRDLIARSEELGDELSTATQVMDLQFKRALVDLAPILVSTAQLAGNLAASINYMVQSMQSLENRSTARLEQDYKAIMATLDQANAKYSPGVVGNMGVKIDTEKQAGMQAEADAMRAELKRRAMQQLAADLNKPKFEPFDPGNAGSGKRNKAADAAIKQAEAVKALIANLEHEQDQLGRTSNEQELYNALKSVGVTAESEFGQQIAATLGPLQEQRAAIEANAEMMNLLGDIGKSALNGIIDAMKDGKIEASELGDILGDLLSMAGQFFLNQGFSALKSAIIPGYAVGTNSAPGGISRINEKGGEIVDLPRGARVYPHDVSMAMASAAGASKSDAAPSITFAPNVTMTDGSPASIARLERAMGKMQAEFEYKVQHIIRGRGKRWFG